MAEETQVYRLYMLPPPEPTVRGRGERGIANNPYGQKKTSKISLLITSDAEKGLKQLQVFCECQTLTELFEQLGRCIEIEKIPYRSREAK